MPWKAPVATGGSPVAAFRPSLDKQWHFHG